MRGARGNRASSANNAPIPVAPQLFIEAIQGIGALRLTETTKPQGNTATRHEGHEDTGHEGDEAMSHHEGHEVMRPEGHEARAKGPRGHEARGPRDHGTTGPRGHAILKALELVRCLVCTRIWRQRGKWYRRGWSDPSHRSGHRLHPRPARHPPWHGHRRRHFARLQGPG